MSFQLDRLAGQLDWNLLRTFMVIVQERSITGAAQRLNVTQPSVSAALRRLEERLEHRLVERGAGRDFSITQAGEVVYSEALEIYGGILRLKDLAEKAEKAITGTLVISRSSHLDMAFLTPLLSQFHKRHPGVTFSIRVASCYDVNQALAQRDCSIGFCTRVYPTHRFNTKALAAQEFGFFCGARHPLFGVEDPDAQALARSEVACFDEDHMAGALAPVTIFRVRNGIGGDAVAATSSVVDLIDMVHYYEVIGALPRALAGRYGPDLWEIPLAVARPKVDVFSVINGDRHFTPAEQTFLSFLEENGLAAKPRRVSDY